MATTKQRQAARQNVKKAQRGAAEKQTLTHLPSRRLNIAGRSKMGKDELKRAVAKAR